MHVNRSRTPRPAPAEALQNERTTPSAPQAAELPASLTGLEVSEAAMQEWLAAGGERRKQPRKPQPEPGLELLLE